MHTRRVFLKQCGLGLGVLALVVGAGAGRIPRVGWPVRRGAALSLYMDKPFVGRAVQAFAYEPRGVLRAAEPLMCLSEDAMRMHNPWL